MAIRGIDISSQSEDINYTRIKENNIKFIMIRAGFTDYDKNKTKKVDEKFEENYKKAKKYKLNTGLYYCSRATTKEEAEEEVNYFLNIIKDRILEYPAAIQIEDDHNTIIYYPYNQKTMNKDNLLEISDLMYKKIKNQGYKPLIRTYEKWYNNIFRNNKKYDFNYWIDDLENDNENYDIYSKENDLIYSTIDYSRCKEDVDKVQIIISEKCLIGKIKNYINAGYKILKSKIRK